MSPATFRQPSRADGVDARQRLLAAGLRLFAERGFEKTSVRALAQAAGVNVGAISYYFGDKASLYERLFSEPPAGCAPLQDPTAFAEPGLPPAEALRRYYVDFLEPLKAGDAVALMVKLHFREMIEPTGAWDKVFERDMRPQHHALVRLLVRTLGLERADPDLQRLAHAISALAVHYYAFNEGVQALTPRLLATPKAIDILIDRLVGFASSMIEGERERRASRREQDD
jgi:AcrR family transcriptional regulator